MEQLKAPLALSLEENQLELKRSLREDGEGIIETKTKIDRNGN